MRVLFLFLDGIGLGGGDPATNPFAAVNMPVMQQLLDGRRWLFNSAPFEGPNASLLSLDACLGVDGYPQSATGQAVLLTGRNIPHELGYHYGPKPNQAVASTLRDGGLFGRLKAAGHRVALLNAYPPRYFEGIESGKRLYSSIPLTLTNAGLPLFNHEDLAAGRALSADFTGQGWHDFLGLADTPVLEPAAAGRRLADLSRQYDFSFFEYWSTDYAGHKQDMSWAVAQLEMIDQVLGGLLESWDSENEMLLLTSDHGNMEDLSVRRHTSNPVPLLLVGPAAIRHRFTAEVVDITGIAPLIYELVAS